MTKQQEIDTLTRRLVEARHDRDAALLKIMTLESDLAELREIVNPMGQQLHAYRQQLNAIRQIIPQDKPHTMFDVLYTDKIYAILYPETQHEQPHTD